MLSLISSTAFAGSNLLHQLTDWAEGLHFAAFVFSSVMVTIAIVSFFLARKRDCVSEGACHHEPCAPKKKASWRLLAISLTLYAINLAIFLSESLMSGAAHTHG
jgi:hypothetical protein